jgi:hypothetical protein
LLLHKPAGSSAEHGQFNGQSGQRLADVIVEQATDGAALFGACLGLDSAGGQMVVMNAGGLEGDSMFGFGDSQGGDWAKLRKLGGAWILRPWRYAR